MCLWGVWRVLLDECRLRGQSTDSPKPPAVSGALFELLLDAWGVLSSVLRFLRAGVELMGRRRNVHLEAGLHPAPEGKWRLALCPEALRAPGCSRPPHSAQVRRALPTIRGTGLLFPHMALLSHRALNLATDCKIQGKGGGSRSPDGPGPARSMFRTCPCLLGMLCFLAAVTS